LPSTFDHVIGNQNFETNKSTMKNSLNIFTILALMAFLTLSCDNSDPEPENPEETEVLVLSNISEDTTWETGKIYTLGSRISVLSGVTLSIEPGVIIKGEAGSGANATALVIARGAKIMAEGTASEPIIFTSIADEIEPGDIASPNLDPTLNGLWGGLIVLGYAPISADAETVQIEGIPPSDQNGLYGGTDAADNSGVIRYISIRHGGANIGEGNEINGLTLGGVGSGTTIENVDAIDTDQGWSGTLDNFAIINPGDECFELDGGEGTFSNMHTIKNGTVYAGLAEGLVDLDDKGEAGTIGNSDVDMHNIYFTDMMLGQDFDDNSADLRASALEATLPSDTLALTDFFKKGVDAYVTAVADGANTVGADLSKLTGWTWAGVSGALK
jgi:hypothetical protein